MKGPKIFLISVAGFLTGLLLLQYGDAWALLLLAATTGVFAGFLWTQAELWAKVSKKPFCPGLPVLWGGILLVGTSMLTGEIFWGCVGVSPLLFGLAMWLHQRQRENPRYQEQEQLRREQELQRKAEQERFFVIEEVTLTGAHSYFTHGGGRGAMLGCLLGGPLGTLVGLLTGLGKQIDVQHFAVRYTNGRTGTEEHRVGSKRYRELMRYVRWEE